MDNFNLYGGHKYKSLDQFENGSNMIVSIIYKMILDYINDHQSLPPVLFLNVDNCGRENKVIYLQYHVGVIQFIPYFWAAEQPPSSVFFIAFISISIFKICKITKFSQIGSTKSPGNLPTFIKYTELN